MAANESGLEISRRYFMGISAQMVYGYTGVKGPRGEEEHEFLFLPTLMDIPPTEPTLLKVTLIPSERMILHAGHPYLRKSEFRKVSYNPSGEEHSRLLKFMELYKNSLLGLS